MPTANEKKALWFFALIALSGSAVRLLRGSAPDLGPVDTAGIAGQMARVDSVRAERHKAGSRQPKRREVAARPGRDHPLNLDSASAAEIDALPGIGATLAERIVAHRDSLGGLGAIEALCGVAGLRQTVLERLRPLVTFTSPRRPLSVECGDASSRTRKPRERRTRDTR